MADDIKLPKPITVTGSAFNNVSDKIDSLEKKEEKADEIKVEDYSEDSAVLPQPVVFGDDDDDDDDDNNLPTTFTRKDLNKEEAVESPETLSMVATNTEEKLEETEEEIEEAPKITESIKPDVDSLLLNLSEESDPKIPTNLDQDLVPEISSQEKIIKASFDEDMTKLPEEKIADINRKNETTEDQTKYNEKNLDENFEIPSIELDSPNENLDLPPVDSPVMTQLDDEINPDSELTNRDEIVNPYTPEKIQQAKQAELSSMKNVVNQVAQLNDSPNSQPKVAGSKVGLAAIYVFLGIGLITGGYFAANSIFGSLNENSQILVQEPIQATPTPTPITEEEPPATQSPTPAPTPSPSPKPNLTTDSKYTYVLIKETPTSWLNARSSATTKEDNVIKKIYPGDTFEYLGSTDNGWFQIKLDSGEEAWISGGYAQRLTQNEYENLDKEESKTSPTPVATPIEEETEEETEEELEEEI